MQPSYYSVFDIHCIYLWFQFVLTLRCVSFQFLTFAERLASVNIDVIHRIDRTGSYDEVCRGYSLSVVVNVCVFYALTQNNLSGFFLGGRNILLGRTDKMERPQLDGAFQYVII